MKVVITSFCVFGYLEWLGSYLNIKSNVLSLKKKAKKYASSSFFTNVPSQNTWWSLFSLSSSKKRAKRVQDWENKAKVYLYQILVLNLCTYMQMIGLIVLYLDWNANVYLIGPNASDGDCLPKTLLTIKNKIRCTTSFNFRFIDINFVILDDEQHFLR